MVTSKQVKRWTKELGADLVGIGNIERWEGAPLQQDPRQIMPECRSIIAVAFRVMRGSLRGIEEGTFFSNYSAMGYGGITYLFMPMVVMGLCQRIEDEGHEALPMGHQSDWRAIGQEGETRTGYSVAARPGQAIPDVMLNLRIGAYLCGLGEIGWSKMFLTPQFGPRQRVGLVLTEAKLEPDPIFEGGLCDKCMACVKACPGHALKADKKVVCHLPGIGKTIEWNDIDCDACDIAFRGGQLVDQKLAPDQQYTDPWHGKSVAPGEWSPFYKKPRNLYNTGQAVCGARGCTRACMIHLEAKGKLSNKFEQPFRRRKPWLIDWQNHTSKEADTHTNDAD